jgi:hypothetical protein
MLGAMGKPLRGPGKAASRPCRDCSLRPQSCVAECRRTRSHLVVFGGAWTLAGQPEAAGFRPRRGVPVPSPLRRPSLL